MASLNITTDAQLDNLQKLYGIYDSIAVFDIKGNPIAQTKGKKLDNHFNRLYIQNALKANDGVLSQPLLSSTSGTFSVYAASTLLLFKMNILFLKSYKNIYLI